MSQQEQDFRYGIRKVGTMVSMVANTTPVTLYTLSAGRMCKLTKLHLFNNNAANTIVQVGTGLGGAWAQAIPGFFVVAGMELVLEEEQLVQMVFNANLTIQATVAAAAPNNVQAVAEVEEYQGPTG